MSKHVDVYII